jgi:hypothetical protein
MDLEVQTVLLYSFFGFHYQGCIRYYDACKQPHQKLIGDHILLLEEKPAGQ